MFFLFFLIRSLESGVCFTLNTHLSSHTTATPQVLSSHMWLVLPYWTAQLKSTHGMRTPVFVRSTVGWALF